MRISSATERQLTELDFIRLKKFTHAGAPPQLDDVLDDAEVVAGQVIGPDVVTMNSRLIIRDLKLERRQVVVVCYPRDANPATGHVSVLSPAGLALLGLPVGATATWTGPKGEQGAALIEEILYQPEATGDYLS